LWEKSGDGKLFFGTYILPLAGLFFTWGFFGHLYMSNLGKNDLKEINGTIEWIGSVTETSISRSGAKYHPLKIELQGQSGTYRLHDNFKYDFKRIQDNLRVGDNVRLYRRTKFQSIISWGKTNDIFVIEKDNTIIFGLEKMIAFKKEQMDTFAGFSMICWTLYILYIYDKKREKVKNLGSRQQNI
jgi:hypothetical protein